MRPVKSEQNLRYLDWVLTSREAVAKASNGRIGYIHLPNTAVEGNRELFKYFYPQTNTDALIFDDRYNGGGFVPDRMIELLSRPLLHYWVVPRHGADARAGIRPHRTEGDADQRPGRLGRRRLPVLLQASWAWVR